jgi:hypothetical protein
LAKIAENCDHNIDPIISTIYFFQVKESLNHVQVLVDHQLMDMAWSDNLTDCEENFLKVSTHLQVGIAELTFTSQRAVFKTRVGTSLRLRGA